MNARSVSEAPFGVIPLDDAHDRGRAGGKAATLAVLRGRGHRVPGGFVVPIGADLDDPAWPAVLSDALDALGGVAVAVRSSAAAEDAAATSLAGQLRTSLDVSGADAVLRAAGECVRSGRAVEAAGGVAVLVQRMVSPEAAGIAFGVNPATGDPEVLVSAVRGRGDRLAAGEADGESWVVPDGGAARPQGAPSILTADVAEAVAALTRRLGEELGSPQDVEWALSGGEIHVLQSRPVTAAPLAPAFRDPPAGIWFRDEAHVTSTVSAFAADTYMPAVARAAVAMGKRFGLLFEGMEAYWRSGDWYARVVPPGGKEGPAPPGWLLGIVARLLPSMRARTRAARSVLETGALDALADGWNDGGRDDFEAEVRALAAVDRAALDDDALLAHLDDVLALMQRGQDLHFRLFVPWMVGVHRFVATSRSLLGWDDARVLSLLAGASEASIAPARELAALARDVAARTDAGEVASAEDPLGALRAVDLGLARRAEDWLDRWGLRASGYDPGAPTLAEQPGLLLGLLREGLARGAGPEPSPPAGLDEARAALAGRPADVAAFEDALATARRVFPLREDNVLYTDNLVCGLARRAALEIGRRLRARGALDRPEDAVEMHHRELREALAGRLDGAAALARRRRRERAWVAAHPGPSFLGGAPPGDPPDLRSLPAPLRAFNEPFFWMMAMEFPPPAAAGAAGETEEASLAGIGAWPGTCRGTARIVRTESDLARVRPGDVLVTTVASPAWSVVFPRIGALVTEVGGLLSHAAIVAREHGVPAVLGARNATSRLRDEQRVVVDGGRGTVTAEP